MKFVSIEKCSGNNADYLITFESDAWVVFRKLFGWLPLPEPKRYQFRGHAFSWRGHPSGMYVADPLTVRRLDAVFAREVEWRK